MNHILTHSDEFPKPQEAKAVLELLGEGTCSIPILDLARVNTPDPQGLILAEGKQHRKQVSPMTLEQTITLGLSPPPKASHHGTTRPSIFLTIGY